MIITNADIYIVRSGKIQPIIVELWTEDGISGIGEAAIAYGIGQTATAGMILDLCDRIVVGSDARRIEDIWTQMYDHSFWAKGGGAIVFAGMSAIEQALWDIKGKALGVPVHELLGGKVHDKLPVYANGWNFDHIDPLPWAKAAERPLKDGFTALKCYPLAKRDARTLRHVTRRAIDAEFAEIAYQRVKVLRDVVGPDIEIMLDLSGALTTDETIRLCRRYEDLDITFIEEPADPFDIGALNKVAERVNIPVAAGERIYTRYGFRKLIEPQGVDIVQPDIGNTGGIMESKKIAAMAEAYNMRFAPHNCASTLSTAVAISLSTCVPNFMTLETYPYFSDGNEYVDVLEDAPEKRIAKGFVEPSEEPGLGVTLARDRLKPFKWAESKAA